MTNDERNWWLGHDGKRYGPYAISDIRLWLVEEKLTVDTLAWQPGMAGWMPLSKLSSQMSASMEGDPPGTIARRIRPRQRSSFPWQAAVLLSVVALVILRRGQKRRTLRSLA